MSKEKTTKREEVQEGLVKHSFSTSICCYILGKNLGDDFYIKIAVLLFALCLIAISCALGPKTDEKLPKNYTPK